MLIKTENWNIYIHGTNIDESFDKFNDEIIEYINISSSKYILNSFKNKNKNTKDWNYLTA